MPLNIDSPPSAAAQAWREFRNLAISLKRRATTWSALCGTGTDGAVIASIRGILKSYRPRLGAAAQVAGIQQVARAWFGDAGYDFDGNKAAANQAANAVFAEIDNLKNPGNWSPSETTFTPAELVDLKTALDALIAAL